VLVVTVTVVEELDVEKLVVTKKSFGFLRLEINYKKYYAVGFLPSTHFNSFSNESLYEGAWLRLPSVVLNNY